MNSEKLSRKFIKFYNFLQALKEKELANAQLDDVERDVILYDIGEIKDHLSQIWGFVSEDDCPFE